MILLPLGPSGWGLALSTSRPPPSVWVAWLDDGRGRWEAPLVWHPSYGGWRPVVPAEGACMVPDLSCPVVPDGLAMLSSRHRSSRLPPRLRAGLRPWLSAVWPRDPAGVLLSLQVMES